MMNSQYVASRAIVAASLREFSACATSAQMSKVLIVGGGTGGISLANRLSRKLGDKEITVIEPSENHYYQPLWTLVGAGIYNVKQSERQTAEYIPQNVNWIKQSVQQFLPGENAVVLKSGSKIVYEWLVICIGMQLRYDQVKGANEALLNDPRVCSNYQLEYCTKTFEAFKSFPSNGTAIFTHPNSPIKCGGAPQKAMYLFDDYLRREKKRAGAEISFVTSLPNMFAVPKYAASLQSIARDRSINCNFRHHLIEVQHSKSLAICQNLDDSYVKEFKYDMLHIVPPMCAPEVISSNVDLRNPDSANYVHVDKATLRHVKFNNIFALGDCAALPTSKTAAAVAAQVQVVGSNLMASIGGSTADNATYDGYTSCPLITGYDRGIIAEFNYDNEPLETFPFNQAKERKLFGFIKTQILPSLYWDGCLPGMWPGPKYIRKLLHLDFK